MIGTGIQVVSEKMARIGERRWAIG